MGHKKNSKFAATLIESIGWAILVGAIVIITYGWNSDCDDTAGVYVYCSEESK